MYFITEHIYVYTCAHGAHILMGDWDWYRWSINDYDM